MVNRRALTLAVLGGAGYIAYQQFAVIKPWNAGDSPVRGDPKDPVVLYGFRSSDRLPLHSTGSVFVGKVITFCKIADIPMTYEATLPFKAPKGKLPYIVHGPNTVADSHFIIKYLTNTYEGQLAGILDPKTFTAEQRAKVVSIQRIVEDHLYWHQMYSRWIGGWEWWRDMVFSAMPAPLQLVTPPIMRKNIYNKLSAHGIARHSDADRFTFAQDNIEALSTMLGAQPYFLGDKPSVADAIAFPILEGLLFGEPPGDALTEEVRKYPNLVAYVDRLRTRYFSQSRLDN